ncbi:hypothetical protein [Thermogemmatispora sp.]|uniref:BACON domain-containing protein n=1 Tax=Thermogemmatispora sp. TaxID=1968838 RepID=UPI0035E4410F
MRACNYCGTKLPDDARSCERCGRLLSTDEQTQPLQTWEEGPLAGPPPDSGANQEERDEATLILQPEQAPEAGETASSLGASEGATISDWWQTIPEPSSVFQNDEEIKRYQPPSVEATFIAQQDNQAAQEEEEERRRRQQWILPLPVLGGERLAQNQVPRVQGTPPASVPYVRGKLPEPPKASGQGAGAASPERPGWHPFARPSGGPPAWLTLALVAFCAALLITSSTVAAAFTVWSPTLALLSGSSTVTPGSLLHLHGAHFLPGSTITLTLDQHIPLHFSSSIAPQQQSQPGTVVAEAFNPSLLAWQALEGGSLQANGDGTFDITLTVDPGWPLGQHSIQAKETLTSRSASLTFTIVRAASPSPAATNSPTPTVEASPSSTPTATATETASATPGGAASSPTTSAPAGELSCVNPSAVTFGPLSSGYRAPVEQTVTLCASGRGAVGWRASWDSQQAPWLSLSATSGLLAAPGEEQISLRANVGSLAAGRYSVEISFSDEAGNPAQLLEVTLLVVNPCLNATPTSLSFTAVAATSDPAPQTLTIQSCSGQESWSAVLQVETKQVWLQLSSNSGTLAAKGSTSIKVSVSSVQSGLSAGSYQGRIIVSSGQSQVTIAVTLTVQPAPVLILEAPQSGSLQAGQDCKLSSSETSWLCPVTIGAASQNTIALNWSSSSSGLTGISFAPASGTLAPGQTVSIQVTVPATACPSSALLLFNGPANSIQVTWSCSASAS